MSMPDSHVHAEGRSLKLAIEAAAATLGVPVNLIQHKLDMEHFKSAGTTGAETVKIFAWAKDPGDVAASNDAEAWMSGLLKSMGREGRVRAEKRDGVVLTCVDVGEAGRHLVGRGGSTLRAIQYLMEASIASSHPGVEFRIDVARPEGDGPSADGRGDDRPPRRDDYADRGPRRDAGPGDRGPRRDGPSGDRGPRRDAGPGDRGPRRDGPSGDRGPRRDDRGDRGSSEDRLRALAQKLARMVSESGQAEITRRALNSYERRLVHTEVANVPGIGSRSLGEGTEKQVEIYKVASSEE
ncbi:MAG: hypothetical protein EXR69_00145 [Myxococcales bacterium]|nr:hypothetical protein [Myxococcales bacterium]